MKNDKYFSLSTFRLSTKNYDIINRAELTLDPRFATSDARVENGAALIGEIQTAIGDYDWAHWQPIFETWDAPWELVKTIHEVADDPQAAANGYLFDVTVEDGTKVRLVSGPVGFDGQSAPQIPTRAPLHGEHTQDLLRHIGIEMDEFERLKREAVIQ